MAWPIIGRARNQRDRRRESRAVAMFNLVSGSAATGVSRSTILRAIKAGRLSAERDATNGWSIQPCELFRVFPALPAPSTEGAQQSPQQADGLVDQLRNQIADLRNMIEDAKRREGTDPPARGRWGHVREPMSQCNDADHADYEWREDGVNVSLTWWTLAGASRGHDGSGMDQTRPAAAIVDGRNRWLACEEARVDPSWPRSSGRAVPMKGGLS